MIKRLAVFLLLMNVAADAETPALPAADPSIDDLFSHATSTTAPNSLELPATQPAVLRSMEHLKVEPIMAIVTLSSGESIAGSISTTLDQPFRVWDEEGKKYNDVPIENIAAITCTVVWERMEEEWNFKASGSDIKEYSGRTYPARLTNYTFKLRDGSTVEGAVDAPLHLEAKDLRTTWVLHKRDKGAIGTSLEKLVYVKAVSFRK